MRPQRLGGARADGCDGRQLRPRAAISSAPFGLVTISQS